MSNVIDFAAAKARVEQERLFDAYMQATIIRLNEDGYALFEIAQMGMDGIIDAMEHYLTLDLEDAGETV